MDILEKFIRSISYKFPKGYPDMKNVQDILLLENELKKLGIDIGEANLAGGTTNYNKPTGAFYKYVELNPKHPNLNLKQIMMLLYLMLIQKNPQQKSNKEKILKF